MKNDTTTALLIVGAGAIAWWYYQQSRGLTFTGAQINPMIPPNPGARAPQNLLFGTPGSTPQTNVFSLIGQQAAQLAGLIFKGPGNTPAQPAPPSPASVPLGGSTGTQGQPTTTPADWIASLDTPAATAAGVPLLAYSNPQDRIYWPPLENTQPDFIAPNAGVPTLGWTLDPSLVI